MIDFKFDALCSIQLSNHREPPEVGLVEKLTGSCIGGWSCACQPCIECYRSQIIYPRNWN